MCREIPCALVFLASLSMVSACDRYVAPASGDAGVGDVGTGNPSDAGVLPSSTRCTPQPVTRASDLAPQLFAWILAAEKSGCHLERRESGGVVNGFPTAIDTFPAPGKLSCDASGCWKALPAFARAWTHRPPPKPFSPPDAYQGEQWTGTVRAERHEKSGELRATLLAMQYGSTALRRFERRYDAAGHLLEDRHYFGSSLWFSTTNSWQGDRLISSRLVDSINGSGTTNAAWSYLADGRLARLTVTHEDSGRVAAAAFSYDDQGRLASVERTLDGQVWSRQSWTHGQEGRLLQSAMELIPEPYKKANGLLGADDLEPLLAASNQLEWVAASPRPAQAGACTPLPHAFGYGYPASDGVYQLGWPVGDRPNGIDADYGFGPAYDVGIDRWFGHDRVEGIWNQSWSASSYRVTIDYDERGRMVHEASSTDGADGVMATAVRKRAFAGDQLISDTRVIDRTETSLTTELRFSYDEVGKLVQRDYTMNGKQVARHVWVYEGGEIARHSVATHRLFPSGLDEPGVIPESLATLPKELPPAIVHERDVAADGRTVTLRREGVIFETRVVDAAGRIVSRRYPPSGEERFSYEVSGELRSYGSYPEPKAEPVMALSYERKDGRLVARHWAYAPNRSDTDRFNYLCP